jgi:hypothetical protein
VAELLADELLAGDQALKRQLEFRLKNVRNNKRQVRAKAGADKIAVISRNNSIICSIL